MQKTVENEDLRDTEWLLNAPLTGSKKKGKAPVRQKPNANSLFCILRSAFLSAHECFAVHKEHRTQHTEESPEVVPLPVLAMYRIMNGTKMPSVRASCMIFSCASDKP